jgi:hypothetical protein
LFGFIVRLIRLGTLEKGCFFKHFGIFDVGCVDFFQKSAWLAKRVLPPNKAVFGKRQKHFFLGSRECDIKQSAFFFKFGSGIYRHRRWKQIFFHSNHENTRKFKPFRRVNRHQ